MTAQRNQNQLTFVPWLINEVNAKHHPGLKWLDQEKGIIEVPWPRAKEKLPLEQLGVIFGWHKYRFGDNCNQNRSPSSLKGTFRAILNSREELTKIYDQDAVLRIQIDTGPRERTDSAHTTDSGVCGSPGGVFGSPIHSSPGCSPAEAVVETAPTWAQQLLEAERANSDASCKVWVTVMSKSRMLSQMQVDLQYGLLIYSDTAEVDFEQLSEGELEQYGGAAARAAQKLFINEIIDSDPRTDDLLYDTLRHFNRGIYLASDCYFNIMAQRNSKARTYFGHSNQGTATQMNRPNTETERLSLNYIYSYMSFLEMAGQLLYKMRNKHPLNQSDQPTADTIITVGQEWTPHRSIHQLPLYIEIKHERALEFRTNNLQVRDKEAESQAIVISLSNSLDKNRSNAVLQLPDDQFMDLDEAYDFSVRMNGI